MCLLPAAFVPARLLQHRRLQQLAQQQTVHPGSTAQTAAGAAQAQWLLQRPQGGCGPGCQQVVQPIVQPFAAHVQPAVPSPPALHPLWSSVAASAATPGQLMLQVTPQGVNLRVWNVQQHLPPGCVLDQLVLPSQAPDMVGVMYRVTAVPGVWGAMVFDGMSWHHINVYASEAEVRAACWFVLDVGAEDDDLDDAAETGLECGASN